MKIIIPFLVMLGILFIDAQANEGDYVTTRELETKKQQDVEELQHLMRRYLAAAKERYKNQKKVLDHIDKAQKIWNEYMMESCNAVYETFDGGSIASAVAYDCKKRLIAERTHVLWENYLTYWDSTEPILPEPKID